MRVRVPLFCRHNRFEHSCSICLKEKAAKAPAPARRVSSSPGRVRGAAAGSATAKSGTRRSSGVVRKQMDRATEDGFRNELIPGIKATADAERLGACIALSLGRLAFPGPHPAVSEEPDPEKASWLAFLLALAGPDRPELQQAIVAARPDWTDDVEELGPAAGRTAAAYRAWAERSGSQLSAFSGDSSWSPQRRFARVFDRLSLPGFGRDRRYELLITLGASGTYELEGDSLHVGQGDDATVIGAKRALNSGDTMLLERRAAALAEACEVPIASFDRALALWERGVDCGVPGDAEAHARIRAGLGV